MSKRRYYGEVARGRFPKKRSRCWMCSHDDEPPILHCDGFFYHGKCRCSAHRYVRDVRIPAGPIVNVWYAVLGKQIPKE